MNTHMPVVPLFGCECVRVQGKRTVSFLVQYAIRASFLAFKFELTDCLFSFFLHCFAFFLLF